MESFENPFKMVKAPNSGTQITQCRGCSELIFQAYQKSLIEHHLLPSGWSEGIVLLAKTLVDLFSNPI